MSHQSNTDPNKRRGWPWRTAVILAVLLVGVLACVAMWVFDTGHLIADLESERDHQRHAAESLKDVLVLSEASPARWRENKKFMETDSIYITSDSSFIFGVVEIVHDSGWTKIKAAEW